MNQKAIFIMPLRNRRSRAIESIRHLAKSAFADHFECLIIQDFDTDNVCDADFEGLSIRVSVVNHSVGGIFYKTALMNYAVALTTNMVIVQYDADILFGEEFLKAVAHISSNHTYFKKYFFYAPYHETADMDEPPINVNHDGVRKKGDFVGDTMIFYRPQFEIVHGYDERMRIWHEEEDIANRILKKFGLAPYDMGAMGIRNLHTTHENTERSFSGEEREKNRKVRKENEDKNIQVLSWQPLGGLVVSDARGKKVLRRNNIGDATALKENLFEDIYGIRTIDLPPNAKVLDIGAHIGCFALAVSERVGEVICYEPETANFLLLSKNIDINAAKKVSLHKKAVAAHSGEIELHINPSISVLNSPVRKSLSAFMQKVPAVSLEEVIGGRYIDLLKIDCEGGEYGIFYDSPKDVFRNIGRIAMEYHDLPEIDEKYTAPRLIAYLKENGFEIEWEKPDYDSVGKTGIILLRSKQMR